MSETKSRLGPDVWMALAAIGWADGKLDQEEADALVRTALDEGLEIDEIAQIEEATKHPISLGDVDIDGMSKADRLFIFAVACWLTRVDGEVTETERVALDKLGVTLKIPEKPRQHAEHMAWEVASLPDGDRPAFYDLTKLKHLIAQRLEEAQRLRAEAADKSEA